MTDLIIPALRFARSQFRYIDNTGLSRGIYNGVPQTTSYSGDRVGATVEFTPHGGKTALGIVERAKLQAFVMALKGKQNRAYIADDSTPRLGSFPASEMLLNGDFANGITGWTAGTDWALSTSNNVMRLKRTAMTTVGAAIQASSAITTVAYTPYCLRYAIQVGSKAAFVTGHGGGFAGVTNFVASPNFGYYAMAGAFLNTSVTPLVYINDATSMVAGDYHQLAFFSMSPCAIADSAPNLFLQSNTFANAAWTKNNVTATDNTLNGPDLLGNMAKLTETAVNSTHEVGQNVAFSSNAQEIFLGCVMTALTRTWGRLRLIENTGSTVASAYFNLATGATGTTATGANWSNLRTGSVNLGGGYYFCWIIARKTNAATSVSPFIGAATADNTGSYLGVAATDAIGVWHGVTAPSTLPMRFNETPTTTTASTGTPQTGASINLKGLPASQTGLLVLGDWFEVDGQLRMCMAPLDSNAAGHGTLQFSPPLARPLADGTAVIIDRPRGRFMFAGDSPGWMNEPGAISNASLEFEEAPLS